MWQISWCGAMYLPYVWQMFAGNAAVAVGIAPLPPGVLGIMYHT